MGLLRAAPDMLVRFDQNALASAGSSPSPPPLLLPPLRPGGKAGQQMAGPYPSASDEWRMMSSRAWQAPVYVHKGGLSFWGHAAGSLPIFKSAWQIFNGGTWIYVSDDFYLTPAFKAWRATQQSPKNLPLSACSEREFWGHTQSVSTPSIQCCHLKHACVLKGLLNCEWIHPFSLVFFAEENSVCTPTARDSYERLSLAGQGLPPGFPSPFLFPDGLSSIETLLTNIQVLPTDAVFQNSNSFWSYGLFKTDNCRLQLWLFQAAVCTDSPRAARLSVYIKSNVRCHHWTPVIDKNCS